MKFTSMNTVTFSEFVNKVSDNIASILQNPEITELVTSLDKLTVVQLVVRLAKLLTGPCRKDCFAILAAYNGKTPEEIEKQNILVTIGQLHSIYNDLKDAEIPD